MIYLYDWRSRNAGVGAGYSPNENKVCCFNVGNPSHWWDWDVSVVQDKEGLSDAEAHVLQVRLAELWNTMLKVPVYPGLG